MPPKKSGFTLVEIIIVIAIISILSVIGIVQYNNFQRRARDAKRQADLNSIINALEVNKTSTGYQFLTVSQFSGGIPATDPQNHPYCANSAASSQPADPAVWVTTCPTGYATVSGAIPPAGNSWKICTTLEGSGSPVILCRSSSQ